MRKNEIIDFQKFLSWRRSTTSLFSFLLGCQEDTLYSSLYNPAANATNGGLG